MGTQTSKNRNDIEETSHMEEDDIKTKKKKSFKDKVRTRMSKSDLKHESKSAEKSSIVMPEEFSDPPVHPKLKILSTDPRSPSAVDRTPIAVESVPRCHVHRPDDDPRSPSAAAVSRTPLRCLPPPSLTLPQADLLDTPTGDRSPLLIETEDPRSPSCLAGPRTPISGDSPAANFLSLCKKYEVEDAVSFINNRIASFNSEERCIKQEILTVPKATISVEKIEAVSNIRHFKEEADGKERIETDVYCILCRKFGHLISEECVSSAICFGCGMKGLISRDCKKLKGEIKNDESEVESESAECEEYVEMEIAEDDLKDEVMLEKENNVINVGVEDRIVMDTLKKCAVNLPKVKIQQASRISHVNSSKKCVKKSNLSCHIRTVHKNAGYACEKCVYKTNNKFSLKIHVQAQHEGVVYFCKKCNYKTKFQTQIKRHMKVEHDGFRYACENCDYKAKRADLLKIHMEAQHEGVMYYCEKCNYKAKFKKHLTLHMKVEHNGFRYACEKCDYKAKRADLLKIHMEVQHEGVMYFCKKCNYKAKYKTLIRRHMNAEHEGIRYACEKCDFKTKYKSNLTKHMYAKHTKGLLVKYGTRTSKIQK